MLYFANFTDFFQVVVFWAGAHLTHSYDHHWYIPRLLAIVQSVNDTRVKGFLLSCTTIVVVISWEKDLRGMICWTDKKNLEEKLMARQALICLLHSNSVIATINSEGVHLIRHIPTRFTDITRNQS